MLLSQITFYTCTTNIDLKLFLYICLLNHTGEKRGLTDQKHSNNSLYSLMWLPLAGFFISSYGFDSTMTDSF